VCRFTRLLGECPGAFRCSTENLELLPNLFGDGAQPLRGSTIYLTRYPKNFSVEATGFRGFPALLGPLPQFFRLHERVFSRHGRVHRPITARCPREF
jgi:hypothetical protein